MSDVLAVFSWWLISQLLGLAVWPLAARWLKWLPDGGYMLAKPIGLLLTGYGLWLLATLGLVQNSTGGIIALVTGLAAISVWLHRSDETRVSLRAIGREHRSVFLAYEALFLVALIGWAIFRAHNPDLSSTEKPMEFAFFNAVGGSVQFPPHDPWLSGYAIAYYYFGYVMMSLLHQLSGVTAGTAFSLSNAFWFALSAASAFGVVADLILLARARARSAAVAFGLIGATMLVLMGNYQAPLEVARFTGQGGPELWQWLDIVEMNEPLDPAATQWPPRLLWWWRASRVIHDYPPNAVSPQLAAVTGLPPSANTVYQELIDEFPQFSFLLGDMHPHVLALPFALLMMALAMNLYRGAAGGELASLWYGAKRAPMWPLYALAVGALGFLNTWDFPIYAFVLAAALALGQWRAGRFAALESVSDLVVLGLGGAALYWPFYRGFSSQASGLAPNLFNGTRAPQFFVMFGPFILIGLALGLALMIEAARRGRLNLGSFVGRTLGGGLALAVGAALVTAIIGFLGLQISQTARNAFEGAVASMATVGLTVTDHLLARLMNPWVILGLATSLAAIFWLWRTRQPREGQMDRSGTGGMLDFALLLYAVGLLLTLGVEYVFIGDKFGTRMNTAFKFYYQAWALWSVASAFALYYLIAHRQGRVRAFATGLVGVVAIGLGLVYPLLAIPYKAADRAQNVAPTLDAMAYTGQFVSAEYAAAQWLAANAPARSVILEAPGQEYNAGTSRFSTWTGLPTVVGWPGHEDQWRGSFEIQGPRIDTVNRIYSTTDAALALELLRGLDVRYVIVGPAERQYPPAGLEKFGRVLPVVYQNEGVTIYQVMSDE